MEDERNISGQSTLPFEQELKRGIYFIGIGGIGMSAIARYFQSKGIKVSGYDKSETTLTKELQKSGMDIHYEEDVDAIPKEVDLVVYTPAIPSEHKELQYYLQHRYKVVKRSDILQLITKSSFNICIAGTHGKTTISTMVAHLLRDSGYGCNAFLGGISVNYGTNFWSSDRNVCVIEADEYDRSFLKLSPDVAIITAMDADHLDIYGSAESMEQAFIDFSMRIKPGGLLVSKFGLKKDGKLKVDNHIRYSIQNDASDAYATNIRMMNGSYEFDVRMNDNKLEDVFLHMGGMHNVENAIAAIAVASSLKIENGKIKAAIKNFKGVKRRFEYIIPPSLPGEMGVIRSARESDSGRPVFIDDYAHHPEELKALINGAKTLFSHRNCTIIFQPHLYTRTRDLAVGFAASLDLADEVILLPIYPAREEPIPGITSELILSKMKNKRKQIMNKEELIKWIKENYKQNINREFGAVLITAGAGDIDALVEPIKNILIT